MAIRVVIRRRIPVEKEKEAQALIWGLRMSAVGWHGYLSSETLYNIDDREDYLVISTWKSKREWDAFFADPHRTALQEQIEALMGDKTQYEIYDYPEPLVHPGSRFFE